MPDRTPEAALMPTPLTLLLRRRMAEEGWGLRDVCRPPDGKRVGGPARATFSKHLQDGYWLQTMPRPKTREELATAVQVDQEVIDDAAFRSLESSRAQTERASEHWKDQRTFVAPEGEGAAYVATGSGGRRDLSDLSLEELAEEQRRIADEMTRRFRDSGT